MNKTLFHLAFPVKNITQTKEFYVEGLGCQIGRENPKAIVLNFYGHQIVAHVIQEDIIAQNGIYPRHFGLIFTEEGDWQLLLERIQQKQIKFYQLPKIRFTGKATEHRTFFLEDPFFNILEFKFYHHSAAIFGEIDHLDIGDIP